MTDDGRPLRPHVRLRIGVTGHRPGPKLPEQARPKIAGALRRVFKALSDELAATAAGQPRWAFGQRAGELVVVSSLAEGADRMVAEAGLEAGAGLDVVLPLPRADYEQDFETSKSRAEFAELLARANSVFELDRPEGPLSRKRGYEAAGLVMLAHADLLIAVWDEGEAAGIGGTAAIVEQAVSEGAPVLLINPSAPDQARLLWTGDLDVAPGQVRIEDLPRREAFALLPEVVRALIAPPAEHAALQGLHDFYLEPTGRSRGWPIYSMFLAAVGVRRLSWSDFFEQPPDDRLSLDWRVRFPDRLPADPLSAAVCSTLLPAVGASDRLAVRYSELYRSAFVFNFLAAAIAVSLALLGLTTELHWWKAREIDLLAVKAVLVTMEIGLIWTILSIWRVGERHQWHQRWLNYRRAAEWLRHLRILSLVGARSPIARPRKEPRGRSEAKRGVRLEQDDWVSWYVRSVERLLPLPNRVTDQVYLTEVKGAVIGEELNGQIAYHHANSHRMEMVAHRLHVNGLVLFITPAVVGGLFLVAFLTQAVTGWKCAEDIRFFVTGLTAALPAFGAALNAVRVQGDFETVGERSAATAARLASVRGALESEPLDFPRLADRTQRAAEVMSVDLSEWQTLFRTRPLSLPA
jgi:hypothetical protein